MTYKNNTDEELTKNPLMSDIAGTDLYAEQISAYVAGSKSIIRQSLFTNDTNILTQFDTTDPSFEECNAFMSISNGIHPDLFPSIISENIFGSLYKYSYNCFVGFLYYDNELNSKDVQIKALRALEIIKRKFEIDLILVNSSNSFFFPFVGYYPDWELLFEEITTNLPMDGYWQVLDNDRLYSPNYLNNHHLSITYLLLNSMDIIDEILNLSTDLIKFDIDSFTMSFLQNFDTNTLIDQMNVLLERYNDTYGDILEFLGIESVNNNITEEDLEELSETFEGVGLSNESHYTSLSIQYEGLIEGIKKKSANEYEFNLWDAIGYRGFQLTPSEKIYITLFGAFISEIDINILCTEIIDATPDYYEFSAFMLEQISKLLTLADIDFDVYSLQEYSFKLLWINDDGAYRSYVLPINLNDPEDTINSLGQLGFQGLPFIPTGILNPIRELKIVYNISNSEPNILITKELVGNNATDGAFRNFNFSITAENVGNISVWGVPTNITIDIKALLETIVGEIFAEIVYDQLWTIVRATYPDQYNSLEDFFNLDEIPKIFYFDTWGAGIVDYYYPDFTNATNLWPYSEDVIEIIDELDIASGLKEDLKAAFTNKYSIWYPENWKLDPHEKISYITDNISISAIDSFTPFYNYNFTISSAPIELPALIFGNTINNTHPELALEMDNESWIIESEQSYIDQYDLEIQFLFKNQTYIDLTNNSLERISILINFTQPPPFLNYEFFNFSDGEFHEIFPSLLTNISRTFSFIDYNDTLEGLFDPTAPENHTIIFKIKRSDDQKFNISINNLDIKFASRDINAYDIIGSRIIFATSTGNTRLEKRSNSFVLSTSKMASIVGTSHLNLYSSTAGDLNTYTITLKNIGSLRAENISISQLIPGIIDNRYNFTIEDNYLKYNLNSLDPAEEIVINFTFYTPNSGRLITLINFTNIVDIENRNSSTITIYSNEVFFSAPIDYESRFPFVRTIEIDYKSSSMAPTIGESFNLTINIKNTGPNQSSVYIALNLSMNDHYGHLIRIDNRSLNIINISYNEMESVDITLKKSDWIAYYYPSIQLISGSESRTIQIVKSNPIILGYIDFELEKSVNKKQAELGDILTVKIEITNIGSICAKNIYLNDLISFTKRDFSLIDGNLVHEIEILQPGETKSFKYKIKAKTQSQIGLKEASVNYYFLRKHESESNDVELKIIMPKIFQLAILFIPFFVAVATLVIYNHQIHKYKSEKYEFRRSEKSIFKLTSTQSILRIEHTLQERLTIINMELNNKRNSEILGNPSKKTIENEVDTDK